MRNSCLLLISLVLTNCSHSQSATCSQIPLWRYDLGMVFYYPRDVNHNKPDKEVVGYSLSSLCRQSNDIENRVLYKILSGKKFTLKEICRSRVARADGNFDECLVFGLLSEDKLTTVYYAFPFNALAQSRKESDNGQKQSQCLPEAIFVDSVVNYDSLKGTNYFTKFPVNAKDGKTVLNHQMVKITGIEKGIWQQPVKIVFTGPNIQDTFKNVVICPTNVPQDFIAGQNFSNYFQKDDPRIVNKTRIPSDNLWNLICKGKITVEMDSNEVKLALGDPVRIITIESPGQEKTVYQYPTNKVTFDNNGKVLKIKSDSEN